jgi:hypothetical protein
VTGDQRHTSTAFNPRKESWYPLHMRLRGLMTGLDGYAADKFSCSHRSSNPGPSSPQQVTIQTTLSRPVAVHILTSYAIKQSLMISVASDVHWLIKNNTFYRRWDFNSARKADKSQQIVQLFCYSTGKTLQRSKGLCGKSILLCLAV